MNIDVISLLTKNDILLLFVVLAGGLCIGRLRIGSIVLGNTIGVLLVALLLGHWQYTLDPNALNLGFMLFIFCVGIEAGPNFFSIFMRDGKQHLLLALLMVSSGMLIALVLGYLFDWDIGLSAGMLAGSMTSTPVLVGAGDALTQVLSADKSLLHQTKEHLSLGYALTYLVGLLSLIVTASYLSRMQHQDLSSCAQQIMRERGLDNEQRRRVYLPVIRAYRVGPELVAWVNGQNLRELGLYRKTGCYIETLRRHGMLAAPDSEVILQEGDEIALIGYPENHACLDASFRDGKEVFDRELLNMRIVTEEIVLKNNNVVGKLLGELDLTEQGCFLNRIIRSQIEMPIDDNIVLNKGDILQVSGDVRRVKRVAERLGFIAIHSQLTDLLAFCFFFILGLLIGLISFQIGRFSIGIGAAAGLLTSGVLLGFLRANHPTFGYIPQGALNMVKEFGLLIFMAGVGLSAGGKIPQDLGLLGEQIILGSLAVSLIPVIISYLFGAYVLRMNRALLFGAIMGARTCAPALDIITSTARSNIPALGYAGTYAIANVLLTLAGSLIVIIWSAFFG